MFVSAKRSLLSTAITRCAKKQYRLIFAPVSTISTPTQTFQIDKGQIYAAIEESNVNKVEQLFFKHETFTFIDEQMCCDLINFFARSRRNDLSFRVIQQMQLAPLNIPLTSKTVNSLLTSLLVSRDHRTISQIFQQIKQSTRVKSQDHTLTIPTNTALPADISTFNLVIKSLVIEATSHAPDQQQNMEDLQQQAQQNMEAILIILQEIRKHGLEANLHTYGELLPLLKTCNISLAEKIFKHVVNQFYKSSTNKKRRRGNMSPDDLQLFHQICVEMMDAHIIHSQFKEALNVYELIKKECKDKHLLQQAHSLVFSAYCGLGQYELAFLSANKHANADELFIDAPLLNQMVSAIATMKDVSSASHLFDVSIEEDPVARDVPVTWNHLAAIIMDHLEQETTEDPKEEEKRKRKRKNEINAFERNKRESEEMGYEVEDEEFQAPFDAFERLITLEKLMKQRGFAFEPQNAQRFLQILLARRNIQGAIEFYHGCKRSSIPDDLLSQLLTAAGRRGLIESVKQMMNFHKGPSSELFCQGFGQLSLQAALRVFSTAKLDHERRLVAQFIKQKRATPIRNKQSKTW